MTEPERRIAELRTLLARLERQRAVTQRVSARIRRAAGRAAGNEDAVAATALHLQHYYTAVEDALLAIANELDGAVPKGSDSHRLLLEQMSLDIAEVRPRLLDDATSLALDTLRRFRHRVRHAYDEEYAWARMAEPLAAHHGLEELLPRFFDRVAELLHAMIRALEATSE